MRKKDVGGLREKRVRRKAEGDGGYVLLLLVKSAL